MSLPLLCPPTLPSSWAGSMWKRRAESGGPRLSVKTILTRFSLPSSEKTSRTCCPPCPTLMTISFCAGSEVRAEAGKQEGPGSKGSRTVHGPQAETHPPAPQAQVQGRAGAREKGPSQAPRPPAPPPPTPHPPAAPRPGPGPGTCKAVFSPLTPSSISPQLGTSTWRNQRPCSARWDPRPLLDIWGGASREATQASAPPGGAGCLTTALSLPAHGVPEGHGH